MFETYRILIQPGGTLAAQPHLKGAQEYITVFAGQVEIWVADQEYAFPKGTPSVLTRTCPMATGIPGGRRLH